MHASHIGSPAGDRYFPAVMTWDEPTDPWSGDDAAVTITVADQEAPRYLAAGRPFTLWCGGPRRGVITRQVYTDGSPS